MAERNIDTFASRLSDSTLGKLLEQHFRSAIMSMRALLI